MVQDTWRCLLVLVVIAAVREPVPPQQPVVYNYPQVYQQPAPDQPLRRVGRAAMEFAESLVKVVR